MLTPTQNVVLTHITGSKSGHSEAFSRESVVIGRGDPNDVSLDPFLDPTVSAQHAEIRNEEGDFVLYDMGSLNGTFLNGHCVRRAELEEGDEISLGRQGPRLRFTVTTGKVHPLARLAPRPPAMRVDRTVLEKIPDVEGAADSTKRIPSLYWMMIGALLALIAVFALFSLL